MKIILALCIIFITCKTAFPEQFTLSGMIRYSGSGEIYIYLVDEDVFSRPFTGISVITQKAGSGGGELTYSFSNLTTGIYGIRCYQDRNGNGKLDRGLFGPTEPWDMSFNCEKPAKWIKFDQIAFPLVSNTVLEQMILD